MEKIITVADKEIKFKATASTPRRYREMFGRDLFKDINDVVPHANSGTLTSEDLMVFENLAYTMAKQADDTIPNDPDEWLDGFEFLSIYEVLPQLVELWGLNTLTLESPKKKQGRQKGN